MTQATEKALSAELDKQRRRVAAVHARLSGQAATCLAGITPTKSGMSLFVQHCILPRVTYSAEVCPRRNPLSTLSRVQPEPVPRLKSFTSNMFHAAPRSAASLHPVHVSTVNLTTIISLLLAIRHAPPDHRLRIT